MGSSSSRASDGNGGSSHEPSNRKTITENMVREQKNRNVYHDYEVTKEVGVGSMGAVSKVKRKAATMGGTAYKEETKSSGCGCFGSRSKGQLEEAKKRMQRQQQQSSANTEYALKTIQLGRVTDDFIEELRNEIAILRTLDHPNIVKLYEVYEDWRQIFMVMELCAGGDLYARNPYSETEAANIVGKLLSAVAYMHKNKVVHRDLKFENIMFESTKQSAEIKVIDFGLSKKFLANEKYMSEGVGTIYTMAPQVLQGVYTSQADLWSVGVIAYMLLSSTKPFYHRKRRYVIDKIMRCDYNFDGQAWSHVSPEAKKFVSSLIRMDPKKRLNAEQALRHKWLSREYKLSDRRPDAEVMDKVQEGIADYSTVSEFKKLALRVVAHKSSAEEIVKLRSAFDQYDASNDGIIAFWEFREALSHSNYSDEELNHLFESLDTDNSGTISYTEFIAATIEARGVIEENRLADAFDRIDADDTGFISRQNVADLLGKNSTPERIERFFADADFNNDGKINFNEFLKAARKENNSYLDKVWDESSEQAKEQKLDDNDDDNEAEKELLDAATAVIPGGKFEATEDNES